VVINVVQIVVFRFFPKPGFGVDLIPQLDPTLHGVAAAAGGIQLFAVAERLFQLFLDLTLFLAEDVLVDGLSGFGVVSCRVPALPASVFPLADAPLAVGTFLGHIFSSPFQRHTIPSSDLNR
jgi:hypothetical protein